MAAAPESWTRVLSAAECDHLIGQANRVLERGTNLAAMTADDFDAGPLTEPLAQLRDDLIHGRGFALWTGLPVARLARDQAAAIFLGIGAHLGSARSQNGKGHVLGHVTDLGADSADPNTRIYQTHERQTFHTDSCDVVALLCLRDAAEGGDSMLVSAETIWNRMVDSAPDLAHLLTRPIATDRRGEVPPGENPWFEIPVFAWHKGKMTVMYQRQYIDSAQRFDAAPRLTRDHVRALDLFDALANDAALNFKMRLAPGDMQFVYNHALLHDRTGFTDHAEVARRRHLLRLWLSVPGDRALPPSFAQRYGAIKPGNRGGILVKGTSLNAPLDPA